MNHPKSMFQLSGVHYRVPVRGPLRAPWGSEKPRGRAFRVYGLRVRSLTVSYRGRSSYNRVSLMVPLKLSC